MSAYMRSAVSNPVFFDDAEPAEDRNLFPVQAMQPSAPRRARPPMHTMSPPQQPHTHTMSSPQQPPMIVHTTPPPQQQQQPPVIVHTTSPPQQPPMIVHTTSSPPLQQQPPMIVHTTSPPPPMVVQESHRGARARRNDDDSDNDVMESRVSVKQAIYVGAFVALVVVVVLMFVTLIAARPLLHGGANAGAYIPTTFMMAPAPQHYPHPYSVISTPVSDRPPHYYMSPPYRPHNIGPSVSNIYP